MKHSKFYHPVDCDISQLIGHEKIEEICSEYGLKDEYKNLVKMVLTRISLINMEYLTDKASIKKFINCEAYGWTGKVKKILGIILGLIVLTRKDVLTSVLKKARCRQECSEALVC